jgi:hypothetical protein
MIGLPEILIVVVLLLIAGGPIVAVIVIWKFVVKRPEDTRNLRDRRN